MKYILGFLLLCSFPLLSMSSYSDAFGRNVALGMSAAAYSNSPEECIARIFPNSGKLVRQVEVDCDDSGSPCAGFTAVDTASKMIIVAFRGSGGFIQLIIEGADEIFGNQVPFIGGKVASYFLNAFSLVWNNGLKDAFLSTKNIYPNYGVFITGHSLGGAMAALAAGAISTNGLAQPSDITLMTMGEPRTGNSDFVYYFDRLGIEAYRITHNRDIVVHLPPEGFNYYQHANEIYYGNDMSTADYVECDSDESDNCSDSNFFDISKNDHTHYFGEEVSTFGSYGCYGTFTFLEKEVQGMRNISQS